MVFDEDFLRDNPDVADPTDEPDEIELAFARIREQVDEGLGDCDDKLDDIMRRLPEDLPAPEPIPPVDTAPKVSNQTPLNKYVGHLAETPAPMSDKARATLRAAGGSSWQILLGFGISFAVRVGVLGVWLGSFIDKKFFGGQGFAAMGIILLVIAYSFYMLYRDVTRADRLQKEAAAEILAAAERPDGEERPK